MTMTYEQFKAHLVKMLLTEYDIKEEDFTFLPKGATSDDPKML